MKEKIKKLVNLYKDNPMSHEGLSAYTKAKQLIEKHGLDYSDFGMNDFLTIYQEPVKQNQSKKPLVKAVKSIIKKPRQQSVVESVEVVYKEERRNEFYYELPESYQRDKLYKKQTNSKELGLGIKSLLIELLEITLMINDGNKYDCFFEIYGHVSQVEVKVVNILKSDDRFNERVYYKGFKNDYGVIHELSLLKAKLSNYLQ